MEIDNNTVVDQNTQAESESESESEIEGLDPYNINVFRKELCGADYVNCHYILIVPETNPLTVEEITKDQYVTISTYFQSGWTDERATICGLRNVQFSGNKYYAVIYDLNIPCDAGVVTPKKDNLFGTHHSGGIIFDEPWDNTYSFVKEKFNPEFSREYKNWFSTHEGSTNGWAMIAIKA